MSTDRVDAVVVGAGVIGLACARALARAGLETLVLERLPGFGQETSSRNSEVIHAGLYYPTGSLKAECCVAGNRALYAFCAEYGVPHRRCGKLIVATAPAQRARLATLHAQGIRNGVTDLERLSGVDARALEPALAADEALYSPGTGIIDSHALMLALLGDAERHGAVLVTHADVERITRAPSAWRLHVRSDGETAAIDARLVVNSAGLFAPSLARRIEGLAAAHVPPDLFAKGCYFNCPGRVPFSRLVYPVPEPGGLGVHLTLDLAGQGRFGPDVQWVETIEYDVPPARAAHFRDEIRKYWPGLPDAPLRPAYAGIRPKLSRSDPAPDFVLQGPPAHGLPGLVNLFGIESPGLTSCLPLAERVVHSLLSAAGTAR
ncbi:MAG: NAD(P)/FAD-dependent oxidoreductase [Gammaproteobacteria bacterium]